MTTDATLQDFMDYCKNGESEIFSTSFQQLMALFAANFPAEVGTPSSAALADSVNFSRTDDTTVYTTTWQQISNLILEGSAWGYHSQSSAANITLTDPVANYQSITMTTTGKKLILPDMMQSNSIPLGKPQGLVIKNAGSNAFDVVANDGSTVIYSALAAGQIISIALIDDSTANGSFIVTPPIVTGSFTAGHLAVFSNTLGTLQDGGSPFTISINDQTGVTAYTLAASDNGKIVVLDDASDITLTIPQQSSVALPVGFNCLIRNVGAGKVTLATQGSDVLVGNGFVDGSVNSATIVLRKTVSTVNTIDVYGGNAS